MNTENYSQVQLGNIVALSGVVVMIMGYFHIIIDQNSLAFILSALWTVAGQAYSFYSRWKQGDITLGGIRK